MSPAGTSQVTEQGADRAVKEGQTGGLGWGAPVPPSFAFSPSLSHPSLLCPTFLSYISVSCIPSLIFTHLS